MKKENFILLLALLLILSGIGTMAALFFIPVPDANKDTLNLCIGFLFGTGLATLINYYWGSSLGSTKKTDALINSGNSDSYKP